MSVIMAETAKYGFRDGVIHCDITEEERKELAEIAKRSRLRFEEENREYAKKA